jgi:hypothetical protein
LFIKNLKYASRSPSPRNTSTIEAGSSSTATKFRSIVSDVFDGQILSSVQCLTCNLVSSRIETFQDLSLPIPSRDQLYFLHQSSLPKNQSGGDVQASSSWFYWMWSLVWGWFWGPSVCLYDCLSAFFSADELKGDNMYRYDLSQYDTIFMLIYSCDFVAVKSAKSCVTELSFRLSSNCPKC